jgi:hypothetical protein
MKFVTDISLYWSIPIGIGIFLFTWWFYRNNSWFDKIKGKWKWLLPLSRMLSLIIVALLLFGFIFQSVSYKKEKPVIISIIDNSSSMLNYKDSNLVPNQVKNYREILKSTFKDDYELVEMNVGSKANYGNLAGFDESLSDLSSGFDKIHIDYYNRNVGGVIFVSDGNFNSGSNPIYSAEKIPFTPIFSLGVGDTIPKRDQYIKNVAGNEVAFLNNKFPVEVDVEAIKMGKGSATVSISKNGKVEASQNIQLTDGKHDFSHVSFILDAKEVGFQSYTVTISKASNEYNYTNNSRTFYIEVVDSRSKILLLASSPHPDVAAFKQVIEQDQNCEVKSELLSQWDKKYGDYNLIIWFDPASDFNQDLHENMVKANIPLWYVIGSKTPLSILQKLALGINANSNNQTDEMQGYFNTGFKQFEISDQTKDALFYFPPLTTKFGAVNMSGGTEVLIYQRIGAINKKEPLLYFNKRGNTKYGVLYGEGIWKWKMNDYVRTKTFDHFSEIIQKSVQYLLVKQNDSPLRITFPKRFTKDEEVIVNATFYNESLQQITTPVIEMSVTDDKGKLAKYQFGTIGNMYKLSMGKMKPGKYNWVATTSFNGKKYKKSGVFVVEDIALEKIDTYANHGLLKQIAKQTNGSFNELKDFQKTIDQIKNRGDIASVSYKESTFNDLIDRQFLFFILLISLTFEWFMRRWHGSY